MAHLFETWNAAINAQAAALGHPLEDFLRLILAGIAGGIVGIEREIRGRQAGFRTYLLVCLGSALVMIVSIEMALHPWIAQSPNLGININVDPARIAYGVMSGIGFLGGGVIVHEKGSVRGLTTAAGLWCIAAVGLTAGFGMYLLTILATGLIFLALWLLDYAENILPKTRYRTVTVRAKWKPGVITKTIDHFKAAGFDIISQSFDRSQDLLSADIALRVAFVSREQYADFERKLEEDPDYDLIATHEL